MNKNNLTNEDYFSDEDNIQVDDNEMEPESDDSMDEETMKIIYQARNNQQSLDDMNFYDDIPKNKKQQKQNDKPKKTKNALTFSQFVQQVDAEQKAKQPKRFVSKRAEDKRKHNGIDESTPTRSFNPRFPPYNLVHKKSNLVDNIELNEKEFPSLTA